MCDAHKHSEGNKTTAQTGAVSVTVKDMTCGHCSSTITTAIESSIPGAKVTTDVAAHLVSVLGADLAKVREIISLAGYTPTEAPVHA